MKIYSYMQAKASTENRGTHRVCVCTRAKVNVCVCVDTMCVKYELEVFVYDNVIAIQFVVTFFNKKMENKISKE